MVIASQTQLNYLIMKTHYESVGTNQQLKGHIMLKLQDLFN